MLLAISCGAPSTDQSVADTATPETATPETATPETATPSESASKATATPVIASHDGKDDALVEVEEGNTVVTTIEVENAADMGDITYAIKDGDDKDKFVIDEKTGVLSFKDTPDWETPSDADQNNNYFVFVQAIAPNSARDGQFLVVKVTDLPD